MKTKIKKPDANSWILLTFSLWLASECFFSTNTNGDLADSLAMLNRISSYAIVVLLLTQILVFQHYTFKEIKRVGVISIVIIIAVVLSGRTSLMGTWLFIIASKNINIDNMINRAKIILLVMIPLVILLCFMGVFENSINYRSSNMTLRMGLGFDHPNTLGQRIFSLWMCIYYNKKGKLRQYVMTSSL